MPIFEGDDAKRLVKEIKLCRQYLSQARSYRYGFSHFVLSVHISGIVQRSVVSKPMLLSHFANLSK